MHGFVSCSQWSFNYRILLQVLLPASRLCLASSAATEFPSTVNYLHVNKCCFSEKNTSKWHMKDFHLTWCYSFGNEHNLKLNMGVWVWLLSVCAPLLPFTMDGMEAGAGFIPMFTMNNWRRQVCTHLSVYSMNVVYYNIKKKKSGGEMPMSRVFLSTALLVAPAFQTLVHWLHILAFYRCSRGNLPLTFSGNHCPFLKLNHTVFQTHCDWNQVITFKRKVVC